jgi:hypothetical protein
MQALLKSLGQLMIGQFVLFVIAKIVLPHLASSGRHYGNKLMRVECYQQIEALKDAETNSPNFDFFKLSDDNKRHTILFGWNSDFWLKTNFTWEVRDSNRQIVIVCGREFDNVPKPGFWNHFWKKPTHVVAYSDGTTGLISPEQFTNLISAGFASMANLATNTETGLFK